jgi:hypothetical protein
MAEDDPDSVERREATAREHSAKAQLEAVRKVSDVPAGMHRWPARRRDILLGGTAIRFSPEDVARAPGQECDGRWRSPNDIARALAHCLYEAGEQLGIGSDLRDHGLAPTPEQILDAVAAGGVLDPKLYRIVFELKRGGHVLAARQAGRGS